MATLNSKIRLAKNIKLDRNYKSVLNISESDMLSIIENSSNLVYSSNTYSFIRETGRIRISASYNVCIQANYIAFQNSDYSNKWFFAFIDKVNYIANGTSEIEYTIDVFTTWFKYTSLTSCFVIREHTTNDSLGANTLPESVELGEHIINEEILDPNRNTIIILGATRNPLTYNKVSGGYYNGSPSGIKYYAVSNLENLSYFLTHYDENGYSDAVKSLFIAPLWLVSDSSSENIFTINESEDVKTYYQNISRISSLNGYTPRNRKLLTYPYCFIEVDSMGGSANIYKQELWNLENGYMRFSVRGVLTPGCSIHGVPLNYNGIEINLEETITLGKYPQLNWATDQATNWLTQNALNLSMGTITSGLNMATGLATGNLNQVASNGMNILSSMIQVNQTNFISPTIQGNINSGDVISSEKELCFHYYKKTIKSEYARVIDDYFTRLGYKTNRIKVPNIGRRQNYNYVQVASEENACIPNNYNNICLPSDALDIINSLFRSGVTIWNNHNNFNNYSVSNNIV